MQRKTRQSLLLTTLFLLLFCFFFALISLSHTSAYIMHASIGENYSADLINEDSHDVAEGFMVPNDGMFESEQYNLKAGKGGINATAAWDVTRGSRKVRVGVLDSGISAHPDFGGNLVEGYDFVNNTTITDDPHGHGTAVAGIIGAKGDNEEWIAGINWEVTLVPLKVYSGVGEDGVEFDVPALHRAIKWAGEQWGTDQQIDIINYSGSGFGKDPVMRHWVEKFPGLFVIATGNSGEFVDDFPDKAWFDLENCISVGSINKDDELSVWSANTRSSSFGTKIDIFAPGGGYSERIPTLRSSDHSTDSYLNFWGTSASAPHVAGVAALLLSLQPDLTAAELKSIILNSADEVSLTYGLPNSKKLNAAKAVQAITFQTNEAGDTVTDFYDGFSGEFSIPKVFDEVTITAIAANAFDGCDKLTSLTIPDTVTQVGLAAFAGCTNLESLTVPFIGGFYGGGAASGPGGNTTLGYTFGATVYTQNASKVPLSLTRVTVTKPPYVDTYAFYGCKNLTSVVLRGSVSSIGTYAFYGCTKLSSVTLQSSKWCGYENGVAKICSSNFNNPSMAAKYLKQYYTYIWTRV